MLKNVDGARYIKEYNYKMLPGTGPYIVNESDVVRGTSITIRRRKDYWAESHRRNIGLYNFDDIQQVVVRDENLRFEMFKRGDLDYHLVVDPRQWVQEMNFDRVQTGLVQKRKVFNEYPQSLVGIGFNTRREPWGDIRVRRALAHLFNRELDDLEAVLRRVQAEELYFFGNYANPNNPKTPYDPQLAMKLLTEAGWTRDAGGRLVKNGRPLTMELIYYSKVSEPRSAGSSRIRGQRASARGRRRLSLDCRQSLPRVSSSRNLNKALKKGHRLVPARLCKCRHQVG